MRRLKILHIDKEAKHTELLARACDAARLHAEFHAATTAQAAIEHLRATGNEGSKTAQPAPDVIILDLDIPGMKGLEFLAWIRRHPEFRRLPVLVFTDERLEAHRAAALATGANGYFQKPQDFETLVRFTESFRRLEGPGGVGSTPT